MLAIFLTAIALLLVLEGILPFLSPRFWRTILLRLAAVSDRGVRVGGLICLLAGALIMVLVHSGILLR